MADYSDAYRRSCCATDRMAEHSPFCENNRWGPTYHFAEKNNYEVVTGWRSPNAMNMEPVTYSCLLCFGLVALTRGADHRDVCTKESVGRHAK